MAKLKYFPLVILISPLVVHILTSPVFVSINERFVALVYK